ncbi:MAG: folylpolyglutamate synthase/dihydrofolate synthase family protein [Oscillospiraceae bacterium]|nr:folylpolyglutamate synthase/dihydrofolate synthase family protein [Oscillospiraceae bacterium]
MTLSEAMEFIQSAGWLGCRPGLERITDLMERLDNPQKELRYVHITGTNGKGSTAAMLSSILQQAGYRVGLFTSPHLRLYNERIQINGRMISDQDLCTAAEAVKAASDCMAHSPTEFERFTAMALLYFQRKNCDIVVLEVGLGGSLDSTNVIPAPEAAVITQIDLEHTEYLGNTLEEIAATKAGIIKPGCDTVLCAQSQSVEAAVGARCTACGSPLHLTAPALLQHCVYTLQGQQFDYRQRKNLYLGLLGTYQSSNAAVVLDTVDALRGRGWDIPEPAIRQGLSAAVWPGRFEKMQDAPLVFLDGAHNSNGVEALVRCLRTYLPGRKVTFVMGVMADKDYGAMLERIGPLAQRFITVTPDCIRAMPSEQLRSEILARFSLPVQSAKRVESGISLALETCRETDAICIFGSLYQAGAAREFFKSRGKPPV